MRAVLSPPEPDGQILYRPYMDSYKRTPKTEVCQVLFALRQGCEHTTDTGTLRRNS